MELSKNLLFQEIRGVCIIAVIFIHLPSAIENTNSFDYWLSFRKIVEFPVAVFIFISGYFLNIDKEKGLCYFYKKKFLRLAIPYFLWTILYSLLFLGENADWSVGRILDIVLFGGASGHLYFISILLQLIVISPVIVYAFDYKKKLLQIILLSITPLYLVFIYMSNIYYGYSIFTPYKSLPAWILFYILGIAYRRQYFSFRASHSLIFLLVLISLIIAIAESHLLIYMGCSPGFASSQVTIGSFVFAIAVIALLLNKSEDSYNRFLVKAGNYSFGIYLIHIFFLMLMYRIIPTSADLPYFIINQIVYALLTFVLSYFTVLLVNKYMGHKIVRYIGFN